MCQSLSVDTLVASHNKMTTTLSHTSTRRSVVLFSNSGSVSFLRAKRKGLQYETLLGIIRVFTMHAVFPVPKCPRKVALERNCVSDRRNDFTKY